MKFPYLAIPTRQPVPSLGGKQVRHRPVLAVLLTGTATPQLRDGLLDTGADDTVFNDAVAVALGVDLSQAEQRSLSLAGRPQSVLCRYVVMQLRISDGIETFEVFPRSRSTTAGSRSLPPRVPPPPHRTQRSGLRAGDPSGFRLHQTTI